MKWRFPVAFAVCVCSAFASPSFASQGSGCLPTTGTVSGLGLVNDMNVALAAIISSNSGATAPATDCSAVALAGQPWYDTSTNLYKIYDGANWLPLGKIDSTAHLWTPIVGGGTNSLASATTPDLCASANPAATVSITGTTTIAGFGSSCAPGTWKVVTFVGILQLTHNGTSFILPNGGANITTAAGDTALVQTIGTGQYRIALYNKADGTPLGLSSIAANTALCNPTGSGAAPIACSKTQLTTLINQATASLPGTVPSWPNDASQSFLGNGTYGTPAGQRKLLNTLTATGASAVLQDTTSLTSTYKFYDIEFLNLVPGTNASAFLLQVHSGGAYKTTGYTGYLTGQNELGSSIALSGSAGVPISQAGVGNADPGSSGMIKVDNPSTSHICFFFGIGSDFQTGPHVNTKNFAGAWTTAGVVDGFQITVSAGVISSGIVNIYGYN